MPTQDTGMLVGSTVADPDVSFKAMSERQRAAVAVVLADPAVESVGRPGSACRAAGIR